jgi:hypothetical protein
VCFATWAGCPPDPRVVDPRANVLGPTSTRIGGICPCRNRASAVTLRDAPYGDDGRRGAQPPSRAETGGRSGAATYPPRLRSTRPESQGPKHRLHPPRARATPRAPGPAAAPRRSSRSLRSAAGPARGPRLRAPAPRGAGPRPPPHRRRGPRPAGRGARRAPRSPPARRRCAPAPGDGGARARPANRELDRSVMAATAWHPGARSVPCVTGAGWFLTCAPAGPPRSPGRSPGPATRWSGGDGRARLPVSARASVRRRRRPRGARR